MRRKHWLIDDSDDDADSADASNSVSRIRFRWDGRVDFSAMQLPLDTDTDTLLQIFGRGLDLSKPALIQFNVDFRTWPPRHEALLRLAREFPSTTSCGLDDDQDGYLEFQVYAVVSSELIKNIRSHVTDLLAPYRGTCSSWKIVAAVGADGEGEAADFVEPAVELVPRF